MFKTQQSKHSRRRGGQRITALSEQVFKREVRGMDGNKCANPLHKDWEENCTSIEFTILNSAVARWLSVHRIEYGSHCGQYTFENSITQCERCHKIVQGGFTHKVFGWISAHYAMLLELRELKKTKSIEEFRWTEALERLENKYGKIV